MIVMGEDIIKVDNGLNEERMTPYDQRPGDIFWDRSRVGHSLY